MTLNDIPERGAPVHATLDPTTVETIDLDENYPAVEVVANGSALTFTVDGADPSATVGHLVLSGGALSVRSADASAGAGGTTRVKLFSTDGTDVVVTGLR